ncbi:MAG: DUF1697 domain-containing protein [Acidimicrobiales bacterium]
MNTYVALLRGINVGGKNKIAMKSLQSSFVALGHGEVTTYIQSGNVVFRSASKKASKLGAAIEDEISKTFGLKIETLVRTPSDFNDLIKGNPFLEPERDTSKLLVIFLDEAPSADAIASLDPRRSPPDEFLIRGREIYAYCPNGFGRSRLSIDYFERRLRTRATARNWNTVVKLANLMTASGRGPRAGGVG